jgi:hypothetical protein
MTKHTSCSIIELDEELDMVSGGGLDDSRNERAQQTYQQGVTDVMARLAEDEARRRKLAEQARQAGQRMLEQAEKAERQQQGK